MTVLKEKNFLIPIKSEEQRKDPEELLLSHDFDNYEAIDWPLFEETVGKLLEGKSAETPIYDIFDNKRLLRTKQQTPGDLIIIEGRIFLNNLAITERCNMKIFLETDLDLMLSRIVIKGLARKLRLETIIERYMKFIKPSYEKWIEPTKGLVDMVIPNFGQG